jgi:NAD(P)-dependent dehydrogenase (short-subunit alcohol dehydrogenase family)
VLGAAAQAALLLGVGGFVLVESVRREVPAQRLGSGAEAAATVFWLASPEASYVHGAVLPVDGGWRLG